MTPVSAPRLLLRLFLWCAGYFTLLLGALELVLQLMLGQVDAKLLALTAARGGLQFGALLALLLLGAQALAGRWRMGSWILPAVQQQGRFSCALSADTLLQALPDQLRMWKWRLRPAKAEGGLLAYTPPSRLTFGERVQLAVEANPDGTSTVQVHCGDHWTLVDFGNNAAHLQRLERTLAELSTRHRHAAEHAARNAGTPS